MKLNKILALALSGVMAVSMLAGCSNGGKDEGEVIVTPSTGAAATLNANQEKVTFTEASSADLQKATSALTIADLEDLTVSDLTAVQTTDTVGKLLIDLGVDSTEMATDLTAFATNTDDELTKVVVYSASGAMTMEAALKKVAAEVDELVLAANNSSTVYMYSYKGTVSTVTATSVDGTVSGHYIMVTITQTAEEA